MKFNDAPGFVALNNSAEFLKLLKTYSFPLRALLLLLNRARLFKGSRCASDDLRRCNLCFMFVEKWVVQFGYKGESDRRCFSPSACDWLNCLFDVSL